MKKILATLITLLFVLPVFCSTCVFAASKKEKKNDDNYKIQYLNISWWEKYNDPVLTAYIQELYDKNHDLKIAALKVKEGENIVKISFANELPQLSFDGNLGRTMKSSDQHFGSMMIPDYAQWGYQLPLTATYEIDIWGQNRLKTKSIEKQLQIVRQQERASYIALTSAFASTYFNLIKTDKLIEIQKDIVKIQEEIAQKIQKKYDNGLCTVNDVINEQKFLTSQKEMLNNLVHTKEVLTNQLRVYLSDSNKTIERTDCDALTVPEAIPDKFDSSIVEKRPDYIQAEDNIKRIGYDVKVAKKDFLPKFLIYGQLGFNAYHWNSIFNRPAQLANAGIMPSFDFYTGGRKKAVLRLRKNQYEEAMHDYQKTILTGIQEVNDSCALVKTNLKNYRQSSERYRLENKKYILMTHKNTIGAASNLEVLYNKEQELMAKSEEVANKINCLISTIGLYKASGGQDLFLLNTEANQEKEAI